VIVNRSFTFSTVGGGIAHGAGPRLRQRWHWAGSASVVPPKTATGSVTVGVANTGPGEHPRRTYRDGPSMCLRRTLGHPQGDTHGTGSGT
jgi:hypothetical protein